MTQTIQQELTLPAPPEAVYAALTDAAKYRSRSGAPAEIDPTAGGAFSLFGGMIVGCNVECTPGMRLVQAWRVKLWEEGHYSLVRFELAPADGGTRVTLEHTAFPEGQAENLAEGWHANYWEPMRTQLSTSA